MLTKFKIITVLLLTFLLASCAATKAEHMAKLVAQGHRDYVVGNYHEAYENLGRAAIGGNERAMYALGYLYYYGLGVPQDIEMAKAWFREAAKHGQPQALAALARIEKVQNHVITKAYKPIHTRILDRSRRREINPNDRIILPTPKEIHFLTTTEKYLLKLPDNVYTIHLMGAGYRPALTKIIRRYNLQGNAFIYTTYRYKQTWYVLIYGTYKNRWRAQQALKVLPPALKQYYPWITPMSQVQVQIIKNLLLQTN